MPTTRSTDRAASAVFVHRDEVAGPGGVRVAFTDSRLDLAEGAEELGAALATVEAESGVPVARMHQVHGADVVVLDEVGAEPPVADAIVTSRPGLALMARSADCVPVLLADPDAGVVAAAHAGRVGLAAGVLPATLDRMAELGARRVQAWLGPHVCGRCYEVPEALRDEVSDLVPGTRAVTSWGTPSLDLGAGAIGQLESRGVAVRTVLGCTVEDSVWWSHRRGGTAAGRMGALVWRAP